MGKLSSAQYIQKPLHLRSFDLVPCLKVCPSNIATEEMDENRFVIIINYQFNSHINATFVSSKVQPHHHLIQMKRLTGEVSVSSKIPDQNLLSK